MCEKRTKRNTHKTYELVNQTSANVMTARRARMPLWTRKLYVSENSVYSCFWIHGTTCLTYACRLGHGLYNSVCGTIRRHSVKRWTPTVVRNLWTLSSSITDIDKHTHYTWKLLTFGPQRWRRRFLIFEATDNNQIHLMNAATSVAAATIIVVHLRFGEFGLYKWHYYYYYYRKTAMKMVFVSSVNCSYSISIWHSGTETVHVTPLKRTLASSL